MENPFSPRFGFYPMTILDRDFIFEDYIAELAIPGSQLLRLLPAGKSGFRLNRQIEAVDTETRIYQLLSCHSLKSFF